MITISLAQLIITCVIVGTIAGFIGRFVAERFYTRPHRRRLREQEANLRIRNRLLDERKAIQLNRDNLLRIREEAVTEHEQHLRRSAKEAAAAIHAEIDDSDDTVLRPLYRDESVESDDTRAIPVIKEER